LPHYPKPKHGPRGYWCPYCKIKHYRNSGIGNLHKVYIEAAQDERRKKKQSKGS